MTPSWTQPICDPCWAKMRPGEKPYRVLIPDQEQCALCGDGTPSGIYVRLDPATVPYPRDGL